MARAMRIVSAVVKDQRGLAVVLGLVALLALTALALAFLSVSAFEPQIAANLATASQARYLAEGGVEAAFDGLASTANWSDAIAAATGATCTSGAIAPRTVAASPLPGLTRASGTFTVRVRNDCFAGTAAATRDKILTGLPDEDTGGANVDTNDRLIITSTGTIGGATKTVKAVIRKVPLPTINGALVFLGGAPVDFASSSFTIRGVDTRMGGDTAGAGAPVYGIAVGVAANLPDVERALAANQQNAVSGKSDTTPGTTATGTNAVAYDASLTSASVTAFVNAMKGQADISISSTPASPYSIRDMGASCSGNADSSTCFGTIARPKIVYVKGDGSGSYNVLDVSGTSTGAGILMIEDGGLDVTGSFRWNGPVIVTGRHAKIRYHGGDERTIWGAVVVNDTTPSTTAREAAISGSAKLYYSTEALGTVMQNLGSRRFMALYAWQEQ